MREIIAEEYYARADELLELVSEIETKEWRNSNLTKSIILRLLGDKLTLQESWGDAAFTKESTEGTVQMNSEALGKYSSIASLLDWIRTDMFEKPEEER